MNEAKWIKYPLNFTTAPAMRFLIMRHGYEIAGRYFALVEILNASSNRLDISDSTMCEGIAAILNFTSSDDFKAFISDLVKAGLLVVQDRYFLAPLLEETYQQINLTSQRNKKAIEARWSKNHTDVYARITDEYHKNRIEEIRPDKNTADHTNIQEVDEIVPD